jgi:hypothetical protein
MAGRGLSLIVMAGLGPRLSGSGFSSIGAAIELD